MLSNGRQNILKIAAAVLAAIICVLSACQPKVDVKIEPPDKPITINLNIKIDHEVRVKVEKELDQVLSEKSELF